MDRYLAETPEDLMTADQRRKADEIEAAEIALERDVEAIESTIDRMFEDHGEITGADYDAISDALGNLANAIRRSW